MNVYAIRANYQSEMRRAFETVAQSFASPVLTTVLYFVVFGSAIGTRIESVEGVSYEAFILPGLMMLAILTQSIANASFGIFFPSSLVVFMKSYQRQCLSEKFLSVM
jgi:ABC-2 type transport system permease protein